MDTAATCIDLHAFDPSKYFRTGLYTHLCITPPWANEECDTVIEWTYIFRDFGVDHEISRCYLVRRADAGGFLVRERCAAEQEKDLVDVVDAVDMFKRTWRCVETEAQVMDAVFDHYHGFHRELLDDIYSGRLML